MGVLTCRKRPPLCVHMHSWTSCRKKGLCCCYSKRTHKLLGAKLFAAGSLPLRKKKSFSAMTDSCLHVAQIKPHLTSTDRKHFCSNLAVRQRIYLGFRLRHLLGSNVRHGDVFSCETNSPESSVLSIRQKLRYHNFCCSEDTAELPLPHLFLK